MTDHLSQSGATDLSYGDRLQLRAKLTVLRRYKRAERIEAAAREACEAEFTSERLAAMQRLREALDA